MIKNCLKKKIKKKKKSKIPIKNCKKNACLDERKYKDILCIFSVWELIPMLSSICLKGLGIKIGE